MIPQEKLKYTLEEYLELDHNSEEKIEFWDGHIFTLAGASEAHNQIQFNCLVGLGNRLRGRSCRVYPSDMRIKVPIYPPYRYADLSALCGNKIIEKLGKQELLVNPQLIIEVLSDSTESFDRGDKFTYYKSIESFNEYILIAQHRPHITQYVKQSENTWSYQEINGLDNQIHIYSMDCDLDLAGIYENVEFPPIQNHLRIVE
ncbi:MAG: Uma2 family endonuclease [Pyrinomonadaceae bacterium]|jgi:Uma2 family endonuclease|nr:Uma2 family endonuclease [Pyrinomonadaceae bacterium]